MLRGGEGREGETRGEKRRKGREKKNRMQGRKNKIMFDN